MRTVHGWMGCVVFSGALVAGGCGGDDDGGGGDDAGAADAAGGGGDPDAAGEAQLEGLGCIAVAEVRPTNPGMTEMSGGFTFGTFRHGLREAVPGFEVPLAGCRIDVFTAPDLDEETFYDEGMMTVTGTANGVYECRFNDMLQLYACQSTDENIAGGAGDAFVLDGTTGTLTFTGKQVSSLMRGMWIMLNGFPGVENGTRFPIVGVDEEADALQLAFVPSDLDSTGDANSTFATFVAQGPVPGAPPFLGDATNALHIAKEEGDTLPAMESLFTAQGEGFQLIDDPANDRYLPHDIPFEEVPVKFSCNDGATDTCGDDGTGGTGDVIAVFGTTTDGDITDLPPMEMPPAVNQWAKFQCSTIDNDELTISAAAMAAILGTNPTRIQIGIFRFRGEVTATETYQNITLQGHGYIGWSTAP